MKPLRLAALATAVVLGACTTPAPTDPGVSASAGMAGSGNPFGSGDGTGATSTVNGDTTGTLRGGSSLGSGN